MVGAAEMCEQLAEVSLDELFSAPLAMAEPETDDDAGCAYVSERADDGGISPGTPHLVSITETADELEGDTLEGSTESRLELEPLGELHGDVRATAFRTRNEYVDTWEAWAFVPIEEGLVRLHVRDPGWDGGEDALATVQQLLEALLPAT